LNKSKGLNRFLWDMREELVGESPEEQTRRPSRGPMVVPGTYLAKISIGEWSESVQFEILLDPRVADDGVSLADLEEQANLYREVLLLQNRARNTSTQLENELKILVSKTEGGKSLSSKEKTLRDALEEIKTKLTTSRGRYQQPKILDQISYLSSMLNRADQKPGKDAYIRYEELKEAISICEKELAEALNK